MGVLFSLFCLREGKKQCGGHNNAINFCDIQRKHVYLQKYYKYNSCLYDCSVFSSQLVVVLTIPKIS